MMMIMMMKMRARRMNSLSAAALVIKSPLTGNIRNC